MQLTLLLRDAAAYAARLRSRLPEERLHAPLPDAPPRHN